MGRSKAVASEHSEATFIWAAILTSGGNENILLGRVTDFGTLDTPGKGNNN